MTDHNKYEKIAGFLADRYIAVQETKTAAEKPKTAWDRLRPENPDRPGANWWTGLGVGALATSGEIGIGRHGLTDLVQRTAERHALRTNPFERLGNREFQKTLAKDESTRLLYDMIENRAAETGGRQEIGKLLSRNYGTENTTGPANVARIHKELRGLVDPQDTDLMRRLTAATSSHHPANAREANDILRKIDGLLTGQNPAISLSDKETHLLTRFRTGVRQVESAEQLEELKRGLRSLGASISGGKGRGPARLTFGTDTKRILDSLAATPPVPATMEDPAKIKKLVSAFGQLTKGRDIPSLLRRFRRAGIAAGAGTAVGAYALPSLVELGKWMWPGAPPVMAGASK